jgi:hypothetical protein
MKETLKIIALPITLPLLIIFSILLLPFFLYTGLAGVDGAGKGRW